MENSFILNPEVYLIDATAFCYRAFYALKNLSTSSGQPTNAIYGFVNMLNKILKEYKPGYLAVCFDVSRKTFRQEKFSDYKIQRPAMPDALSSQIPFIKQIIQAYRIACFEKEGFEADDLIATFVKRLKDKAFSIIIVSSDKDVLQLVDEKVRVFSPYKDGGKFYSKDEVTKRFGVEPNRIIDVLSLIGDVTDNLPGVAGIGEKTAASLIQKFKSLDNLIENIDKIESPTLIQAIKNNLEIIEMNRQLIKLREDVDLNFGLEDLQVKEPDYVQLYRIFKELEFKRLLKELPIKDDVLIKFEDAEEMQLQDLKGVNELIVALDYLRGEVLFYTCEKKFFTTCKLEEIKDILEDPTVRKIGYDLKRIMRFLLDYQIELASPYFDVMVAAYLLEPSQADYSLEAIAFRYLSLILKEPALLTCGELILKLYDILKKELDDKSLRELFYNVEMPLVEVLATMEKNGIKLDENTLAELSLQTDSKLENIKKEIFSYTEMEFNLNSPKQLREILFGKLKLPIIKKTKTGPSTDEEVLRALSEKHRFPLLLLEYRQLMKLKSTYIEPFLNLLQTSKGKIHAYFSQVSTETGRLACSHPNLQNLPVKTEVGRLIRKAIVSFKQDSWLVSADYSQIELRILAHFSQDPLLLELFHKDCDVHKITASSLYGIDEKDVDEKMRDVAKRINFGIIYGLSPYGLAQELGISFEEAEAFISAYFLRYPKVKEFIQNQIELAQKNGFVSTLLGRRRFIFNINSPNPNLRNLAYRQVINTPIQGTAADLIKAAMIRIHRIVKELRLKVSLILQIHDELLFDVEEKDLTAAIPLIKENMENILKFSVPIKTVIKRGKNWLEMEEVF